LRPLCRFKHWRQRYFRVQTLIFKQSKTKKMTLNNFFTYMILGILFYPVILFYIAVIVVIYLGILKPIFNKNKNKKNGKI
jgi:hypothetical protein